MTINLKDFSDQLATVVEAASASVVTVSARPGKAASGTVWEDGLVVTSSHAIVDQDQVTVRDGAGDHRATLLGRDNGSDLAVLKVEGLTAKAAVRGGAVRPGNLVLALGRPSELRASVGHVVSTESRQRGWRGGLDGLILSDAHLYEGFSGGPLLDAEGHLVAINSWYYGRGSTRSLTVESTERVVRSLQVHGRVKKPYLGIGTQPVLLSADSASRAGQERGLMIISVEPDSPAASAGLLQGDTLLRIGGIAVAGMRDLFRALQALEVDTEQTLQVIRAGASVDVKVRVGERAEPQERAEG